jgi:hypothetical protein
VNGAALVGMTVLSVAAMGLNIGFWWLVVTRWNERFRRRCERRYGVVITIGGRGHWNVVGGGPWYRRLGIEMLHLAYFMGAFVVWALLLLGVIGLMALISG